MIWITYNTATRRITGQYKYEPVLPDGESKIQTDPVLLIPSFLTWIWELNENNVPVYTGYYGD